MEKMVLILHISVCFLLIILVLLQSGKEGMGVIFGGGSNSLFGSTGAGGVLVKLTTFAAVIFLATSLGYNLLSSARFAKPSSVIDLLEQDPLIHTPAPEQTTNATQPGAQAPAEQTPQTAAQ